MPFRLTVCVCALLSGGVWVCVVGLVWFIDAMPCGVWLFVVRSFCGLRPSRLWSVSLCRLPCRFGGWGAMLTFTESLILAQDERWRRA